MKNKKITIVALIVAVISLTVGFAAFSSTLTISSSATVTPNSSDFKVIFSSSADSAVTGPISGGSHGSSATLEGTKITGIVASFTEPGESVTYDFYVRNDGSYDAYLNNVRFGTKTCTPGEGATASLVEAACDSIYARIHYGISGTGMSTSGIIAAQSTDQLNLSNYKLVAGEYVGARFDIIYTSSGARADGPFTVSFGDLTFEYSTVD